MPGREYALSVSAGPAVFDPKQSQTLAELIAEADRRMYPAKNSQRSVARPAD